MSAVEAHIEYLSCVSIEALNEYFELSVVEMRLGVKSNHCGLIIAQLSPKQKSSIYGSVNKHNE